MPETARSPLGSFQFRHQFPAYLFVPGYHHLGYAFSVVDGLRLARQVHQRYHYLTAVIAVYSAG